MQPCFFLDLRIHLVTVSKSFPIDRGGWERNAVELRDSRIQELRNSRIEEFLLGGMESTRIRQTQFLNPSIPKFL